ncbi:LamG-like jellyroll fold domain-containing protein [Naasia sp. SYSU D00948]|uniref:LamG-like jellyroll fold domain-containing protein n=1 Tax=Naasia sp. SYSU D00948 TaxID=2817379 RepID=UPI001B304741|nr:LamG-like jellyroll fold domain-containing protein [Naasia sp. SYSU D00948]
MPTTRKGRRRRLLAVLATTASLIGSLVVAQPALADTAPPAGTLETVSTDALPTVQIDGIVWTQKIVGNTVFAGGSFSNARPAGAAAGTNQTPRANLLAYDIRTGALITTFAPSFNGVVRTLDVSADGTQLFVGGDFTTVNGQSRSRVAAVSVANGALNANFRPVVNNSVHDIAVSGSTVYLAGNFTAIGSSTRLRGAAVAASNGAVLPFAPSMDARARAVVASPDGSKIVFGGHFTTLNGRGSSAVGGDAGYGLGAVDSAGNYLVWNVAKRVKNAGPDAAIWSLDSDSDSLYGTAYHFGPGGNLEGTFRADWATGNLVWVEDCHGDTYDSAVANGVVYIAGHPHYCSTSGGFPQTTPTWTVQRAMAWTKAPSGARATGITLGYPSWEGEPLPGLLNWWPDFYTGQVNGQASWSVAANSQYVVFGGEFPGVNQRAQQGLVRFAVKSIAPNDDRPRLTGANFVPKAVSPAAGTVQVTWLTNYDRDNQFLTYQLLRNGTVIHTATQGSRIWWDRPSMSFLDQGLTPGQSYTYQLRATDPFGNSVTGNTVSVTAAGSGSLSTYSKAVLTDGAVNYWRLGETSGTTLRDIAGGNNATAGAGVLLNQPGALSGDSDRAATFSGTSTGVAASQATVVGSDNLTVEAWFQTTSRTGGKIVGLGNNRTGDSSNYDRHVYLDGNGRVYFGAYNGQRVTIQSGTGYNDGRWHHVVATLTPNGARLYLDGVQVAARSDMVAGMSLTGYWKIGGDSTWAGSKYLLGSIDEVAIYGKALSASTVSAHYQTGKGAAPAPNQAPTASFTASVSGSTVTTNGSGSTDADGTIAGYRWDFGDGATATGATASHTYSQAGTYRITLTVTDDDGATGQATRDVTISPPADGIFAADAFERTTSSGWGTASTGGAWTLGASSSVYSTDGDGVMTTTTAGRTMEAFLTGASSESSDVHATVTFGPRPQGSNVQAWVMARRVAAGSDYRARAVVSYTNGAVTLQVMRGGTGLVAAVPTGITYVDNQVLHIRVQAAGTGTTTVRAKIWADGTPEPTAWLTTATDSTAGLQQAGHIGVGAYIGGSVTNLPYVVRWDDVRAQTIP